MPQTHAFLLFPGFSTLCLANAVEPLRAANTLADAHLYRRFLLSVDGSAVASSSGIEISVDGKLGDLGRCDALFLVSSYGYTDAASPAFNARLHRAARQARILGGLDTGAWLLAKAGLLNGYRATIHWQEMSRMEEEFPDVYCSMERYVIDRDRITAGGATTVLDLMLRLIRERNGDALALDVMRLFLYDAEHSAAAPQRGPIDAPFATRAPVVAKAVVIMENALEEPLAIPQIAAAVGCSQRHLERQFVAALGVAPHRYYRSLRLAAAKRLLQETAFPLAEIAVRLGFSSPSVFSRAFFRQFGTAPRDARRGDWRQFRD